ncbi:MAG: amidohydrolase family protein [Candidatus Bathyarchaeia archaeon]
MIIDCHEHLPSVRITGSLAASKNLLNEELRRNGIDHAILIPDNADKSEIGSLDEVLQLVEGDRRFSVMGTLDAQKRDWKLQTEKLGRLMVDERIVAVKIFPGHDPVYPTDRRLRRVCELCIQHDLPVVIHTGAGPKRPERARYNDPKHIVKVARRFPALKIVIAHYFFPRVEYCYKATKACANIYFDTSALADDEVVAATGQAVIRRVLSATANERPSSVVFGTDYAMCSISSHLRLIKSLDIDEKTRDRILSKNAADLFHLRT